ncbi:hypothetical protein GCM10011575_46230 [Microlunatus endophyticus]|uniref:Outer membrane lipoprotein-sorting protein n=1 Tax=Microlunatus endophyticus TaxID=1716077 RepID=A0A917W8D0_9ACTN|nr:hypothetical protein [Microlunatus endophyticus]GGL82697.1 hypothetical protein GCM10011575_46230 [Microlunatus endophyticus]
MASPADSQQTANRNTRQRRRMLAWVAPLAAAALAVGGGVLASNNASAEPPLPKKTAQQLLTAVAGAKVPGLSGTVTETANLGLPSLPTGSQGGPMSSSDFSDLVSGTHTLKVWTSGQDKSRVALLGTYGESDLIRNGKQAWLWSSKDKQAIHTRYVGSAPDSMQPGDLSQAQTPQQLAEQALKAIDPTTTVSVSRNVTVAGRPAYELVLAPKDDRSLVGQVMIAVDAKTSTPLQVAVTADGQTKPALSAGFTKIDFAVPDASTFSFSPPKGTKVTQHTVTAPSKRDRADARKHAKDAASKTTVVGKGWTSVVIAKADQTALGKSGKSGGNAQLQALPRVSGSWGSGRLLSGALFSAVITDDGRIAVGAVRPQLLYDALQK